MTEPMPMPPPAKKQEMVETKETKSKGEKFFDRAVYVGIAGFGTFFATIGLTYLLKYGAWKGVHKWCAEGIEKIANKVAPGKNHKDFAEEAAMTTNLMMGGNLMLIPIGIAEHHKVALVSGLNTSMNDETPKEEIQKAPKQTWMSLLKSRAVAWLAVFAAFKGIGLAFSDTMETFKEETGNLLCKIAGNRPTQRMGEIIENGVKRAGMVETKTFILGKIAALDVFATIGSATLLYLGGHFFARKQEEKKELRAERKQATATSHVVLRDVADEAARTKIDAPEAMVSGSKLHEGKATEVSLAAQL